jgi:hypothetical protein
MKEIDLPNGVVVIVDDEDYAWLSTMRWHLNTQGYAARKVGRNGTMLMHRLILGLEKGDERRGDHIDGNRLDNRRANLRTCTHAENNRNRRTQANNSTGYRGVSKASATTFRAQIKMDGVKIYLGAFSTAEEAHQAYCEAAKRYHGEFVRPA